MAHSTRDDGANDRGGPQWRQGILGALATLLAILAGGAAHRAADSWWITLVVVLAVVGLVALVGRPLLSRR